LPIIRTSPDHGPGYAIAGKNVANEGSFREAIFQAVKLYQNRETSKQLNANPLSSKSLNKEPEDS
jgi:4-hydroxythreonine-4-phosphate dehydrogenase